jgi:hypothetical protein
MSLDYTCYTPCRQRPLVEEIEGAIGRWQLVATQPDSGRRIASGKRLPAYCLIWGWKQSARSAELERVMLAREEPVLAKLTKANLIGCCELSAESFGADAEQLEFMRSKRNRDFLATARLRYDTRSSASGNALTWELQKALCLAIARLDGGLLEEPQLGRYRLVAAS